MSDELAKTSPWPASGQAGTFINQPDGTRVAESGEAKALQDAELERLEAERKPTKEKPSNKQEMN